MGTFRVRRVPFCPIILVSDHYIVQHLCQDRDQKTQEDTNMSLAEKIFKEEWEKTKAYYRANGMTEEQIESMHEFERSVFNSDRTFYEGSVELFVNTFVEGFL